ncbi:AAA family ATPase [Paraliomyxa miuraensis]|uniref:AAA family ATPase n=1 Tax=Paraliomyxa miuraensis TaxID=376150 RepID=UPI0022563BF1|nr:ATP-binding protein [Paraliomyxa miuraensis]MCX4242278.1 ATP-binding protein [Paraliomyxa miuraensis]
MLSRLHTRDVGPASEMTLELGSRLNLLTGDNGLGKSFVLDVVWWVLTGSWASAAALPSGGKPRIEYEERGGGKVVAEFSFANQRWGWSSVKGRAPRGSVLYLGVDRLSAFVLDRNRFPESIGQLDVDSHAEPTHFSFTGRDLWDGMSDASGRPICNGIVRDWVNWMRSRSAGEARPAGIPAPFDLLEQVLAVLSPGPDERFVPGPPRRVTVADSREIPTLRTPWERDPVPITLVSAGIKRVLELAYALVWAWFEHVQIAELLHQPRQRELLILVDEPETHLHPRWQRTILPALVEVAKVLDPSLNVQLFVTTHSPVVLASIETIVEPERDRLFHFDGRGADVHVDALDWVKQGDAVGWLSSAVFEVEGGGRSLEATRTIRWADAFMLGHLDEIPLHLRDRRSLEAELRRVLGGDDEYWTYWYEPEPKGDVAQ